MQLPKLTEVTGPTGRPAGWEAAQPEDIANALVYAFAQPANVNPQEILIMPTRQTYP